MAVIQGLDNLLNKYNALKEVNYLSTNKIVDTGINIANKNYLIRNNQTNMPIVNGVIKSIKKW